MPRWITTYTDLNLPVATVVEASSREEAEALLVQRGVGEMLDCSEDEMGSFPRTPRPTSLLSEFVQHPTSECGLDLIGEVQRVAHLALRANPGLDPAPLLSDAGPIGRAVELVGWVLHDWFKGLEDRDAELEERIYKLREDLRELEAKVPGLPS